MAENTAADGQARPERPTLTVHQDGPYTTITVAGLGTTYTTKHKDTILSAGHYDAIRVENAIDKWFEMATAATKHLDTANA